MRAPPAATVFVLALLLPTFAEAQRILTPDPEPFRRGDEIDGRDVEYEEETFLHRFSYRFRPARERDWSETSEGFRGTAGSVRSDELFVAHELRKTIALDDPLSFVLRHSRNEDFDGRYDRTLTGVSLRFADGWHGTVLAEVVGSKEDIDLHLEVAYVEGGSGFRAVLIPVDFTFDGKSDSGSYDVAPYTGYLEGRWRSDDGTEVWAWVNANPHTALVDEVDDFRFSYDNYSAEVNIRSPIADGWRIWLSAGGEIGERDLVNDLPAPSDRDFSRKHLQCTAQIEREVSPDVSYWIGARYFRLDERDRRPTDPTLDSTLSFRESMLYSGVAFRVTERLVLWPSVYLEYVDDEEDFPLEPALASRDEGFVGKLTFPAEFSVGRGATITVNAGILLHEVRFGGGNVQVQIPF